ncbi:hypothetical protein P4O66_000893 [Electrophorus voltai]|uniref:Uncharacterized protein n=1 Tax=Electrophorus voltai TaxID=2609070 RepID=A0AAD8ZD92_9TELE|nr:hypothetical protein P4O66_000893 [Electrophorus voltai]
MEVEEYPHRDPPSHGDAKSSESKEPPAPKALPRIHCPGASKLTRVASREAPLLDKVTPPPEAKSSRAYAPTLKPCASKKAAVPIPEPGQSLLPRLARDTSRQAGQSSTQPTTGGLVGVPSPFPGLLNVHGGAHVPVTVTVSVPITLNVPVTLLPFVPVPVSVCVPASVIVLLPVLPQATLLTLAHGGLSGPPTSAIPKPDCDVPCEDALDSAGVEVPQYLGRQSEVHQASEVVKTLMSLLCQGVGMAGPGQVL